MSNLASTPFQPSNITEDETVNDLATKARSLGLKPVRAWVPDATKQVENSGASRTQRARTKAENAGLKQVSVTLPLELHPLLKDFAARTKAGEPADLVMAELIRSLQPSLSTAAQPRSVLATSTQRFWVSLDGMSWWRRWLLRWLLPGRT